MSQQATMKHKTSRVRVASMGRCGIVVQLVFMFLLVFSSAAAGLAGESKNTLKGKVTGTVVDAQTGDPLVGTNVFFEGTMIGTASDLDGNYTITNVPPGSYDLVLSMIGYAKTVVQDVKVEADEIAKYDIALKPEALESDEVVVMAELIRNTESALLKERQKAVAVSDAISAEAISRTGSGDAAEAMTKVTGASLVDNKYVYVRGLGDRYSNTLMNGALLPSADPDRNSVSIDVLPSNFLESIVTVKTFTPDQPGSFTGGSVNIRTTTFPERFKLSFSTSTSYNTQSTLEDGVLTYPGGATDWLGIDDGTREIPAALSSPDVELPDIGSAFTNREKALELDRLSKSFNSVMTPTQRRAPINQSHSFSIGNQTSLFGKALGYFASLNYGRKFSAYDGGTSAQYQLTGKVAEVNELTNLFLLSDSRGSEDVLWGGLANLSLKLDPNHSFHATYSYNRSGESTSRYQVGPLPRDLAPGTFYETRVLRFVERELQSAQLSGEHVFSNLLKARVEWTTSLSKSKQDEPDLRFFSNDFTPVTRGGATDTLYSIAPSNYSRPVRYFRDLEEDVWDSYLNVSIPFKQWSGFKGTFKLGGAFGHKERTFRERRFEYFQSSLRYDGNPETFFSDEKVGIVDSTTRFFNFGNYIVDASQLSNNYDGDQDISAVYGMVDLPLFRRLRLITGVRFESTRMDVASVDSLKERGALSTDDILPSLNLIYNVADNVNLRAAYGRTLARPTFRELAPYASFDFVGDFIFIGNASLKRTLVDNFDLRWEWFPAPGEILAVSGFYKNFDNPIERAIVSNNNQGQFQNVDHARVMGLEFELRKRLGFLHKALDNFQFGGNLTLINSKVDIPEKELLPILELNPDASDERALQGQSPYVLNLDLGYANRDFGTSVNVFYNVFGRRLSEVSLGGTPNVFEQPRGMLDMTLSQRIWRGLSLKFGAKNLLNSSMRKAHTFKGEDFVVGEHKTGRTFTFGTSYNID